MSHVDDRVTRLSDELAEQVIQHECYHDCVFVPIPGGQLEVKFWEDGSESVQLLHRDFHTHLEIIALEESMGEEKAFASLVRKILTGERPVVEETSPDGSIRITIEYSLEGYLQYLSPGSTYKVLNAT